MFIPDYRKKASSREGKALRLIGVFSHEDPDFGGFFSHSATRDQFKLRGCSGAPTQRAPDSQERPRRLLCEAF